MTTIEKWIVVIGLIVIGWGLFILGGSFQKPNTIIVKKIITIETPKKLIATNKPPIIKPIPPQDFETKTMLSVASEYELNDEETKLLFTIRRIENGREGLEFGVGDGIPNHPARRFAGDFKRSFTCQAMWAAGTIKNRFTGSLKKFAARYCFNNRFEWHRMAVSIIQDVKIPVSYDTCVAQM